MDRMLYVGMNAARNTQLAQTTTINNLANATTPGFRGDFHVLVSRPIEGPYYESRIQSDASERASHLGAGPVQFTNRTLDVAIQGDGWLAVQAADGSTAYSRRGDLQITAEGLLTNGAGQPVLGADGPLTLQPFEQLFIGDDGAISLVPQGQSATTMATVGRLQLVKLDPEQVFKRDDGLMAQKNGEPGTPDASVKVRSGYLEGSNISAVDAMVSMISHSRMYEMQVKLMKTAEGLSEGSARLMRME